MKLIDETWYDDDACIECGDELFRESKVPGLCQVCFDEAASGQMAINSQSKITTVTIIQMPPPSSNDNVD